MDVSQLNRSRVNESRVNCSVLNASGFDGACLRSRVPGIGADIMKSMVLWYDLKKQGATNESMAENPVLRDLSGNGHDATCYNFAWSGMSGVGRYSIVFHTPGSGSGVEGTFENINSYTTIFTRCGNGTSAHVYALGGNVPRVLNVRISGITGTGVLVKWDGSSYNNGVTIADTDGIWELSCDPEQPDGTSVGLKVYSDEQKDCNVTIELIPQYPHALVSDGVDDYAIANKPVLDDYTLIVKRQIPQTRSNFGVVASTRHVYVEGTRMSFSFEAIYPDNNNTCTVMNYLLSGQTVSLDLTNYISYMTSESYNGQNINKNSALIDSDYIYLFCGGKSSVSIGEFLQVALYSVILFNRTLTPEEIEWVKTNLIETEQ